MADETNKEALEAVEWIDGYVSRLRAEIDALRAALEDIQLTAHYAKDFQGDAYDLGARCARIEQRAKAALNTQPASAPAAEWTPRLGEEVWINADSRVGTVIRINQDSDYPYGVAWDSPAQVNEWYAIEDISRHEFD